MKAYLLLCKGFEEVEAIATADVLKRADIDVVLVSPYGSKAVEGAHGITVIVDECFENADVYNSPKFGDADAVILPGGQPGTGNLAASRAVADMVRDYDTRRKIVAAICAAPTVLGAAGLLENRKCTCFPGCESGLAGGIATGEAAVIDGNIITGKSMGCALPFGVAIVSMLLGDEEAERVKNSLHIG